MSSNFSYAIPNENEYLKAVGVVLRKEGYDGLYNLLKQSKCSIENSGTYSRSRWNGFYTTVIFQIPLAVYADQEFTDEDRKIMMRVCGQVMPSDTGLDVMDIQLSPLLSGSADATSLEGELTELADSLEISNSDFSLPQDVMEKGRVMAEVYFYLYSVENFLRIFIEKVCMDRFGEEYFEQLTVPRSIAGSIRNRKEQESKNQWMGVRGGSELFYLDFKDLADLITNNWDLFDSFFPNQSWITSKIDDLGNLRNLVAHNSILDDHERDVIRTTFRSIVRQLNPHV